MKPLISFLLLINGLLLTLPNVYSFVNDLDKGHGYLILIIGLLSIVFGIWIWFED